MAWIIREGQTAKSGKYLWEALHSSLDWTLPGLGGGGGVGIGTIGGGTWRNPATSYYHPWWGDTQGGATLFSDRREAVRMAARFGGRVVRLVTTHATAKGGK